MSDLITTFISLIFCVNSHTCLRTLHLPCSLQLVICLEVVMMSLRALQLDGVYFPLLIANTGTWKVFTVLEQGMVHFFCKVRDSKYCRALQALVSMTTITLLLQHKGSHRTQEWQECDPTSINPFLWTLKFIFHTIFTCNKIIFFLQLFPSTI